MLKLMYPLLIIVHVLLKNFKQLLFADDTLLLANTVSELQSPLNKISVYCKKWNITVNVNKTKVMLFKCSNRP